MSALKAWLPCELSQGMFTDERAVLFTREDGQVGSFFADESLTKTEGDQDYVSVTVAGDSAQPGRKALILPQECIETGSVWLHVPVEKLVPFV